MTDSNTNTISADVSPLDDAVGFTSLVAELDDSEPISSLSEELASIDTDFARVYDVIIVGGGPAGLTAGIYAARAGLSTLILEGEMVSNTEMPGGQLMLTPEIENYPGFAGGSGYDLIDIMRTQAESFGAEIKTEAAYDYLFDGTPHIVYTTDTQYRGKAVILATGAVARRLGVPGEDEYFGRGVSVCATCDGAFFRDKTVAVIGGGDTAVEDALFLTAFATKVYLVHRRDSLRSTGPQARALLSHPKVEIIWDSSLESIHGTDGKVDHAILKGTNPLHPVPNRKLAVDGVFVAIGHDPATESLMRNGYSLVEVGEGGYIAVEGNTTRTNVEGVFTAGDVADDVYRQAITAAASGCKAVLDVQRWLIDSQV